VRRLPVPEPGFELAHGATLPQARTAGAVRAAVEDDAAVLADERCETGGLAALLLAESTPQRRAEMPLPSLGLQDPRLGEERWVVAHVPAMAAGELGDPLALPVELEADDRALHRLRVRADPLTEGVPPHRIWVRDVSAGADEEVEVQATEIGVA